MPCAEPALSRAPLPLSAVVEAAIRTGITKTTLCSNVGAQPPAEARAERARRTVGCSTGLSLLTDLWEQL